MDSDTAKSPPPSAAKAVARNLMGYCAEREEKQDAVIFGTSRDKDAWHARFPLPGNRVKKGECSVELLTDEVEVEYLVGDRYVERATGKGMVEASVFGFFCGRWQEGVRTSLYIEDIDPATIAAYFDTYNADSSAASTPTKCKPSDYVTSPGLCARV